MPERSYTRHDHDSPPPEVAFCVRERFQRVQDVSNPGVQLLEG